MSKPKIKYHLDHDSISKGMKLILKGLHVDTEDRNFKDTPQRFARLLEEMFVPPAKRFPVFTEGYNGVVLVREHVCYTLCPHHMLPVKMSISLAYAPAGRVVGLSKLPRIIHDINRMPMLQEDLTTQIADRLMNIPKNTGAAVLVVGDHGCMKIRGVKSDASTITHTTRGIFEDPLHWANFLKMIDVGKGV